MRSPPRQIRAHTGPLTSTRPIFRSHLPAKASISLKLTEQSSSSLRTRQSFWKITAEPWKITTARSCSSCITSRTASSPTILQLLRHSMTRTPRARRSTLSRSQAAKAFPTVWSFASTITAASPTVRLLFGLMCQAMTPRQAKAPRFGTKSLTKPLR